MKEMRIVSAADVIAIMQKWIEDPEPWAATHCVPDCFGFDTAAESNAIPRRNLAVILTSRPTGDLAIPVASDPP